MTKFYHAENAGRGLIGGVLFTIYATGAGTKWGVYATDNQQEQQDLDPLCGSAGISSIDEIEYEDCIKKKPRPTESILQLLPPRQPSMDLPIKGKGAVVGGENEEPEGPVQVQTTVETLDQALELGEAKPSNEAPAPSAPKNKVKGKRENQ